MGLPDEKTEIAREHLLDAIEDLAELGWNADQIRSECQHALEVAVDDGVLEST